ncbi:MAG: FG-GAP repeat protein, partial [Candidatus Thermoplasmatota archaeon]|nr:FG-GAP repeat protein [Candidatus Thermoplasmatota archaeon]
LFKKTGTTWTEEQKLLASDGEADDLFGLSVYLDGEYAIIGKPDTNSPGAAYIFKNTDGTWVEEQILSASDGETWDEFGYAVCVDGDYALVGAQFDDEIGSAYIFKREGTIWTEEEKLIPSEGVLYDNFGSSVALHGDYAVVGALNHDNSTGAVYIFRRDGTTWTEEAIVTGSDSQVQDRFGLSVAIQHDRVVAGARLCNTGFKGAVYLFKKEDGTWMEEQKLVPSDSTGGQCFGQAVAIDGDCIFVGAPGDDENTGSAYVFAYEGDTWREVQKLKATDPATNDEFGFAICVQGNTAIIGKYAEDDFTGSAYVFSTESGGDDFSIVLFGGLGFTAVIYNNGTSNATDVAVTLQVEGGILKRINKTVTDTVDIPARGIANISTGLFLGLGRVTVTASANATERAVQGVQIVFLSKSYDNTTWARSTERKYGAGISATNYDIAEEHMVSTTIIEPEEDNVGPAGLKNIYMKADCQKFIVYRPVVWLVHIGPLWFMSEYAYLAFIIDKPFTLKLDGEEQNVDVPAMVVPYRFIGFGPFIWIRSVTRPVDGNVTLIGWCEDVVIHPLEF